MIFFQKYWFSLATIIVSSTVLVLYFSGRSFHIPLSPLTFRLLVMFFLGLSIDTQELRRSFRCMRFQLFIQTWIFFVFPLVILIISALVSRIVLSTGTEFAPGTYHTLLAVAVLPTTISSAVVFTRNSHGNTALSMMSSTTSNILGIILAPFSYMILSSQFMQFTYIFPLLQKILLIVLIPFLIGQLLRYVLIQKRKEQHTINRYLGTGCNIIVLVNIAFSVNQLQAGIIFTDIFIPFLLFVSGYCVFIFLTVSVLHFSPLPRQDRISFLFLCSQKTLAFGVPLLALMLQQDSTLYTQSLIILLGLVLLQFSVGGLLQFYYQYVQTV